MAARDCALRYRSLVLLMERDLGMRSKDREEAMGLRQRNASPPDRVATRRRRSKFFLFLSLDRVQLDQQRQLRHPIFSPIAAGSGGASSSSVQFGDFLHTKLKQAI